MATSFQNKLSDLEARLKRENDDKSNDRFTRNLSLGQQSSPRRPRPFADFNVEAADSIKIPQGMCGGATVATNDLSQCTFGAPQGHTPNTFGAPQCQTQNTFGAAPPRTLTAPTFTLGAPVPKMGASTLTFGGPPTTLGAPPKTLGGPPTTLGAPPMTLGGPPMTLGGPPTTLGAPPKTLGGPPTTLGAPPMTLGAPPMTLGGPPTTLGAPPKTLGGPPTTLGAPPMTLGGPPTTLGAPPKTLGGPPTTLGAPPKTLGGSPTALGGAPMTLGTPPSSLGTPTHFAGALPSFGSPVAFGMTSRFGAPPPGSSNRILRRKEFQLPCSPQNPKPPDSAEIEMKYQEIMKQSGHLNINDTRVPTPIESLETLGELGHGTCGHVVKMRHKETNTVMAVKQMRRSGNREENKRIIMDLDVVLKSHNCPFIVQCIGTFITSSDVWICMELMATCLEKLLKRLKEPIPERILGKVTVATVKALHYLKEEHGVIHRDVKPSNILLDERGNIKLCDFGISGRLVDSKAKTRSAGCAAYMAPERIEPPDPTHPIYDIRADVWSLGISLVELAIGEFPYKNCKTDFEVLSKVLQEDPPILPAGRGFSMDFCSFVCQCLTKDFKKRPKYKILMEHNFIKRYNVMHIDVTSWYADASKRIAMCTPSPSPVSPMNLM